MCTEVAIRRHGLRTLYVGSVRDLSRHFRVVIAGPHLPKSTRINRMAEHCLCPVDIEESARLSGYRIVETGFCPEYVVEKIDNKRARGGKRV